MPKTLRALVVAALASLAAFWLIMKLGLGNADGLSFIWDKSGDKYWLSDARPLLLLALLPFLGLGTLFSLTALAPAQRLISFFLRCLFLGALVLALAKPMRTHDST